MNIENIRQLAQILNESGLTGIEVAEGDTRIRLEKNVYSARRASALPPAGHPVRPLPMDVAPPIPHAVHC